MKILCDAKVVFVCDFLFYFLCKVYVQLMVVSLFRRHSCFVVKL